MVDKISELSRQQKLASAKKKVSNWLKITYEYYFF